MESIRNRLTVTIQGEEYTLCSDSSVEHLKKVVQRVDNIMSDLAEKYPRISRQKLAVLTALNISDKLLKLEQERKSKGKKRK